ncbi:hypothetical protein PIB30_084086 [Stylosanthes scabra]|uniref:Uncharacterized protein n=1 Tax=Stylosanthes scabra TaxID=79078 RepID=A0ABU6ZR65_9FABA|nr:hypothetical protein [Stylosanthes scabra]
MPTTNRSELTVKRAVLIYSIIIGENINVEEIIAKQFYKFIYKTDLASSLPFPSIIAALYADAKMVNETMYYPYQNTARQFREMEAQGVPMTIANLAIHRYREEEMNRERMRHNQTVQEAAAEGRGKQTKARLEKLRQILKKKNPKRCTQVHQRNGKLVQREKE